MRVAIILMAITAAAAASQWGFLGNVSIVEENRLFFEVNTLNCFLWTFCLYVRMSCISLNRSLNGISLFILMSVKIVINIHDLLISANWICFKFDLDRGHRKTPDTASRPLDPSTPVYGNCLQFYEQKIDLWHPNLYIGSSPTFSPMIPLQKIFWQHRYDSLHKKILLEKIMNTKIFILAGGLATSGSAARRPVTNAIPPSAGNKINLKVYPIDIVVEYPVSFNIILCRKYGHSYRIIICTFMCMYIFRVLNGICHD